jgi:hypothetical protein
MDSSDVKNNQKNRSGRGDDSVEDEVQKLFRKNNGKISSADFMKLRQKFNDSELVEKIQKAYLDKHSAISKKAKKKLDHKTVQLKTLYSNHNKKIIRI